VLFLHPHPAFYLSRFVIQLPLQRAAGSCFRGIQKISLINPPAQLSFLLLGLLSFPFYYRLLSTTSYRNSSPAILIAVFSFASKVFCYLLCDLVTFYLHSSLTSFRTIIS
jgi:hypothetical protein